MLNSIDNLDISFLSIFQIFAIGFFYDLLTLFYFLIPVAIYLLFAPNLRLLYLVVGITIFAIIFDGVSEYLFLEEFGKRFNFIAVDYLVYTHEVLENIRESYPLPIIFGSISILVLISIYIFRKYVTGKDETKFIDRLKIFGTLLLVPVAIFYIFDQQKLADFSNNIFNNELAKNGIYSLFSAFRHNELPYKKFYKTIPDDEVFANLKQLEGFDNRDRKVVDNGKPNRKNVILIMVESLSAEYMGIYGNKKNLTPHLDQLAQKSLFFNNLFATGTRTVRGMEAVMLSVPPTPGRSIVKRPDKSNMDSIGEVFKENGYTTEFIYAGYGYFDNMNSFFSQHGFKIVDRFDFSDDEVTFSNAWGVCDEDLLNKTIQEADKNFHKHNPFFFFVMTTSNHRPFTYPDGKIDIPSGTGRAGAVKYTDFALNRFFEMAKQKEWFKDTIFVVIADHNGGSAGKTSLPLNRYRIPLIIYSQNLQPKTISKLSSQIDTGPTLFGLLGISYKNRFFGNNILDKSFRERTFIGNYQKLGYVKNGYLYFLTPDKESHKMKIEKLTLRDVKYREENISQREEKEIITYYQGASLIYELSKLAF